MSERTKLRQLYRQIPSFKCKEGCTDCCGPVPLSKLEADRLALDAHITPVKQGTLTCKFSSESGCSVYDNRPFICRLFGTVDTPILKCPRGCSVNNPLSEEKGNQLRNEYIDLIGIE